MADDKPIIVIKKKGGHGGAHGGAWKIAYADFVTAMMAFFMVMWLLSAAESTTRKAIASYFRRPGIFEQGSGTPLLIGASGILEDGVPPAQYVGEMEINGKIQAPPKRTEKTAVGDEVAELIDLKIAELKEIVKKLNAAAGDSPDAAPEKTIEKVEAAQAVEAQKNEMQEVAKEIKEQIAGSPDLKELLGAVDVKVDADGLNIEIMDTDKTSMFTSGSATILPEAKEAYTKLAAILNKVPNSIDILGHTDAKPYKSKTGSYTNWELSTDRANAARKMLEAQGLTVGRITSVVGRADTELRDKENPEAASNRRITLKLRFDTTRKVKNIVGQDSALLKNFDKVEERWQSQHTGKPAEPVHSLTVRDIIDEAQRKRKEILENPKAATETADQKKEDVIPLSDNPVIRPSEFFDH